MLRFIEVSTVVNENIENRDPGEIGLLPGVQIA